MNKKMIILSTILACLLAISSTALTQAASGPKTPSMKVWLVGYDEGESLLEDGTLDILGEPLDSNCINTLASMPYAVTLDNHTDLGMCTLAMNNQQWPTGDPLNKFYSASSIQANQSLAFRQAIAFLTDRDTLVSSTQYLGGYGCKMTAPIPPTQSPYMDMVNYTNSAVTYWVGSNSYQLNASLGGITYPYNPAMAAYILDKAGFTWNRLHTWRIDPSTGKDLKPLTLVVPTATDDPVLYKFGENFAAELKRTGIPVREAYVPRQRQAQYLQSYDYNLYLGKWSLSRIPDQYYTLYSSDCYYGPDVGGSSNYVGFCNNEFDWWALRVKYPWRIFPVIIDHDPLSAIGACKVAGYLFLKYCASVPLFCYSAIEGYKTGTTGVINNAGYGIDNYYTFLNGRWYLDGQQWDYGLESSITTLPALNVISCSKAESESAQTPIPDTASPAPRILNLMYESLMGTNPFNLDQTEYWIANASSIGSWDATSAGGDPDAAYVNFTIRPDVYWHNGTTRGRNLDVYDVNFSFCFTKACGLGVAWNHPYVKDFDHCVVDPVTNTTSIYFLHKNVWAFLQAGGLPILNRVTWGILWNTADPTWQQKVKTYNPATQDVNHDGLNDIYEDGTGAWIFGSYPKKNAYVTLNANPYYYLTQNFISYRLAEMFHDGAGDVNYDAFVSEADLTLMARAFFTNSGMDPHGNGWNQYNPACDLNGDGTIDINDLSIVTANYGKTMG